MKKIIATAGFVIAGLSLAACSTATAHPVVPDQPATHRTVAAAPAPASIPPVAVTDPGGLSDDLVAKAGQPFTWLNDQTTKFRVMLNSVTYGLAPAVVAYSQDSLHGTPKPAAGKQFVVVKFSTTNIGSTNQSFDPNTDNVTLNVGGVAYTQGIGQTIPGSPSSADVDLAVDYGQYAQSKGANWSGAGVNPGDSAVIYGVYEIPVGAAATSLTVPDHFLLHATMIRIASKS